jgi:hypothetical protein
MSDASAIRPTNSDDRTRWSRLLECLTIGRRPGNAEYRASRAPERYRIQTSSVPVIFSSSIRSASGAVMRKSKSSERQIVGILKDAESGVAVPDLLRNCGVSKATFENALIGGVASLRSGRAQRRQLLGAGCAINLTGPLTHLYIRPPQETSVNASCTEVRSLSRSSRSIGRFPRSCLANS